ncbi:uncharacterized protein Tco025E_00156 [Trypanosoma conorhini]|uniref:Uncharacterized protein n=1 Tax=Trypanosoma conorhini TaxID=83891 RepID=A0A422QCD5_9TRYP|nr:uncharacterized protein Tco025E_00156 [Trypanosoma conorhini]RNF27595.1 hypothetical protein Tco025E_00156 [Trypanosoma conorhini]
MERRLPIEEERGEETTTEVLLADWLLCRSSDSSSTESLTPSLSRSAAECCDLAFQRGHGSVSGSGNGAISNGKQQKVSPNKGQKMQPCRWLLRRPSQGKTQSEVNHLRMNGRSDADGFSPLCNVPFLAQQQRGAGVRQTTPIPHFTQLCRLTGSPRTRRRVQFKLFQDPSPSQLRRLSEACTDFILVCLVLLSLILVLFF